MRRFILTSGGKYLTAKGTWSSDKTKAKKFTFEEVNAKVAFYSGMGMSVSYE